MPRETTPCHPPHPVPPRCPTPVYDLTGSIRTSVGPDVDTQDAGQKGVIVVGTVGVCIGVTSFWGRHSRPHPRLPVPDLPSSTSDLRSVYPVDPSPLVLLGGSLQYYRTPEQGREKTGTEVHTLYAQMDGGLPKGLDRGRVRTSLPPTEREGDT